MHALVAVALAAGSPSTEGTPYDVDVTVETVAVVGALAVLGLIEGTVKGALLGGLTCELRADGERCAKKSLNALDRTVVGNNSPVWGKTSDALGFSIGGLVVAGMMLDNLTSTSASPWADIGVEMLVIAEAATVATMTAQILKFSVRRPRPSQYTDGKFVGSVEHQLSFPSGHTAYVTATAAAYATTFALRHPESPWRFGVIGAAAVISTMTGYARIAGGWHFYTDVFASLILGGTTGWLIPTLHARDVHVSVTPVVGGGEASMRGLSLSTAF